MTKPAIDHRLLPETAVTGSSHQLVVGGCNLLQLASKYGTPLIVYDEQDIINRCQQVAAASDISAVYATKAFLCRALVQLIASSGIGFDFSTAGELEAVIAAGANPAKTVFHGNNKSLIDLERAIKVGVGRIVVDSNDELDRLESLYKQTKKQPKILIRITPGIGLDSHKHVATGLEDTKFGFTVSTGLADKAIKRAQSSAAVELVGLHAHVASQVLDLKSVQLAAEQIMTFAKPYKLPELSLGGGLGVAYTSSEVAPSLNDWLATIRSVAKKADFKGSIGVEPGRSIVAKAGVTLYTVGTIKRLKNLTTYVAVDGGMSDNIRPALYGSNYEAFLPRLAGSQRPQSVRVVGHHCESADIVVNDGWLPADLAIGDVLAVPVTGAYGYSMASNYNRTPKPAVVFVKDGKDKLVIRRETLADLQRLEDF